MKTFHLIISSPEGHLFDDEVIKMSLRGANGDLAILADHMPFITTIQPCDCYITLKNGAEKVGHTNGGILTVSKENTTVISGEFNFN